MANEFKTSFQRYDKSLSKQEQELSGELGIYLNGNQLVDVPNRNGYVYVRLRNNLSEVIQAFNENVSAHYGIPVIVIREGNRYVIKGRDTERYSDWGSPSSFIPAHANQHAFNPDGGGGGDILWVYGNQMTPLGAFPSGTSGSDGVLLYSYQYRNSDGVIQNFGATGTGDLIQYKPVDDTAIMGIVYMDTATGNPEFLLNSGTFFAATITGTEEIVPFLPSIPDTSFLLVAGIRLVSGTTSLGWDNIYDARQWHSTSSTDETIVNFGGIAVQDSGVPIGTGTTLNFDDNLTVTISGTFINIDAGGPDGLGIMFWDEGIPLGTGTILNVVGLNADTSISGTVARLFITGSTSIASDQFRVFDNVDNTKLIALDASAITTANTRTISMPDADIDLTDLVLSSRTAFTPAFTGVTLGTGYTLDAYYTRIGDKISGYISLILGTGGTITGSVTVELPETCTGGTVQPLGMVTFRDTGTAQISGIIHRNTAATGLLRYFKPAANYVQQSLLTSSLPFTFVAGDEIKIQLEYLGA